jgi:hypothetical protein
MPTLSERNVTNAPENIVRTKRGKIVSRYRLPAPAGKRLTVTLPKGFPVRHNKVPGGGRGIGELTANRRVPPGLVKQPDGK